MTKFCQSCWFLVLCGCCSGAAVSALAVSTLVVPGANEIPQTTEAEAPRTVVIDGDDFRGTLVSLNTEGELAFEVEGSRRELSLTNFLQWGAPLDPPSFSRLSAAESTRIVLAGGGSITADVIRADVDMLQAESRLLGSIKIPLTQIAAILVWPPTNANRCDEQVAELLAARSSADQVTLANGDTVEGAIAGIERVEKDVEKPEVNVLLDAEDGRLPFAIANVKSIVFDPRTVAKRDQPAKFRVGLIDGSLIHADDLVMESGRAHVTPFVTGPNTDNVWTVAAGKVAYVEYTNPRVEWLETRTPERYQHVPFLSGQWQWQPARNVLGQALRAGDEKWLHGIGVHSAAQMTYVLREPAQRFVAEVAVDDAAQDAAGRSAGSVVFRVVVFTRENNQTVQTEKFVSSLLQAGNAPRPVNVDLLGAVGFSLIVEFGESGDQQDYADWLNARLIRAERE